MSEETATCATHMEEDEEDSRATPERPAFSPIGPQTNEECNDFEMPPVKTEPADADNTPQDAELTPTMQTQEIDIEGANEISEILKDSQEVSVKAEPDMDEANAVDYDMPLAKTPSKTNTTAAGQPNDLECTRLLSNYPVTEAEKENVSQRQDQRNQLQDNAQKSALDAYLDGLATPIAPVRPRLRVKTEFARIPQTPRREPSPQGDSLNQEENMDTEISPPPPPPLISSLATTDSLADGIATPRISLAAINRLRVKSEFSAPQDYNEDSSSLPSDYFNDLLESTKGTKDNQKESGEVSASNSDEDSEDETIPADFFDDLLQDKLKERIDEARNNELEEKYSDRLKELKRLQKEQEKRNKRKKQKKSKKKSRKRSRSPSMSPSNRTKEKQQHQVFEDRRKQDEIKRSRKSPTLVRETLPPSKSIFVRDAREEVPCVDNSIKIKSEFSRSNLDSFAIESTDFVENVEEIEEVLTPKQKRERAVKRATALLHHLKDSSREDNATIFSAFPFVSTIRKLPSSHSYVQQQIYENRSPLHTVNNVSYKFNSHTTRFKMEEWGLAALPTQAAKVAKMVGCDAQFIHTKLKTIKIPAKLKKVKQEPANNEADANEDEEVLIASNSSLYCNVMTQTDDLEEFEMQRKAKGYDIAIQVEPNVYSIGCQTLETQSPTDSTHQDDEAPIMNIIRDLNENQLMAIHQFAELIRQPNANNASNAMEMYKIQMQIVEIYKISQLPSALATQQTQAINNYTTTSNSSSSGSPSSRRAGNGPQLTIQSVRGADGTQFSINDPRAKSAAYSQRIAKDVAGSSSSNYDPRYSAFSQPSHGRSSPKDGYAQGRSHGGDSSRHYSSSSNSPNSHQRQFGPKSQAAPPTTTKFYGRGGLRRS